MAAGDASVLCTGDFAITASSTLNRNTAACGPKFAVDGSDDTCWSSDKGAAQWLQLTASKSPLTARTLVLQFQGGFVGMRGRVLASRWRSDRDAEAAGEGGASATAASVPTAGAGGGGSGVGGDVWAPCGDFEPEDGNAVQRFPVAIEDAWRVRVTWDGSSDMFGRITLYKLDLLA